MIKMKNAILLVISLVAVTTVAKPNFPEGKFGTDSIECVKNISVYREFIKQKIMRMLCLHGDGHT